MLPMPGSTTFPRPLPLQAVSHQPQRRTRPRPRPEIPVYYTTSMCNKVMVRVRPAAGHGSCSGKGCRLILIMRIPDAAKLIRSPHGPCMDFKS